MESLSRWLTVKARHGLMTRLKTNTQTQKDSVNTQIQHTHWHTNTARKGVQVMDEIDVSFAGDTVRFERARHGVLGTVFRECDWLLLTAAVCARTFDACACRDKGEVYCLCVFRQCRAATTVFGGVVALVRSIRRVARENALWRSYAWVISTTTKPPPWQSLSTGGHCQTNTQGERGRGLYGVLCGSIMSIRVHA